MSKMSKSESGLLGRLPTEILTLIFSKLSAKILGRMRCVCKLWSQIVDEGIPYELPGSTSDSAYFVIAKSRHRKPTMTRKKHGSATFLKISSRVFSRFARSGRYFFENSCHGLLCFAHKGRCRFACLLNPLTQQIIKLPPAEAAAAAAAQPTLRLDEGSWFFSKYGLGFDSATRTYKIVRVFYLRCRGHCYEDDGPKYSAVNTQIYTLGFGKKVSSWRPITCVPPWPLPIISRAVFTGGFLHWVTGHVPEPLISEEEALNKHKIVTFHLSKEEFRLISLPRSLFAGLLLFYHLVDLRGVLALVDMSRRDVGMDIWTMKDHDKEEWVKTCSLRLPSFHPSNISSYSKSVIGPWENGKLLLLYGPSLISFDPNDNQWRCIYTLGLKDDRQSENNNNKLLLRRTTRTCLFYHPNAETEKWTRTQIPPGFYDDDTILCFYTHSLFCTESLLLLSPFSKSD
ncbi:F-box domain containing protein [Trema orientale]|uniref:F-box domain containing protein n=1 Tax=Trema orientale TaxID=63057 RepID=A0A2P5FV71_TREOI|nr:F-box domain containing protein [Trema orientale]